MNEYLVTVADKKRKVTFKHNSRVMIDGKEYDFEIILLTGKDYLLRLNNRVFRIYLQHKGSGDLTFSINGKNITAEIHSVLREKIFSLAGKGPSSNHKSEIRAPMPGVILKIRKGRGELISAGDSVITLEAMKMENDIKSPLSGKLKEIPVKEGSIVEKGALLFSIES